MADPTITDQYIRQAPFIEEQQKRLLDYAEGVRDTPITVAQQQAAGLDPLTLAAMQTGAGIGQYQPYLNTAQGTVGTGLGTLQGMSAGVPQQFQAGSGAVSSAIQGYQGGPSGQPYFNQAAQSLQGGGGRYGTADMGPQSYSAQSFDPSSVSSYMNPYDNAAVQQALSDIGRQGDIAGNQQNAAAVQAGAFGGSRQGLQASELSRNVLEQQGRTAAGMRQAGYQNAMQQAQASFADQQRRQQAQAQFGTQVGQQAFEDQQRRQLQQAQQYMGLGGAQAGAQAQYAQTMGGLGTSLGSIGQAQAQEATRLGLGIGSLGTTQANIAGAGQNMLGQQAQVQSQLGALGQAQTQRENDIAYQNALKQQYEPYQRYTWFSDILKPTIGSSQSSITSATAPNPSVWSQLIGAGIGGLGLNKAIGNPIGTLFGGSD